MAIPRGERWSALAVLLLIGLAACSPAHESGTGDDMANTRSETAQQAVAEGDGPFGLNLSAKLDDLPLLQKARESDNDIYLLKTVPQPSKNFAKYAVVGYSQIGVCEIRAISEDIVNDTVGSDIRARMDNLAEALESKYGRPEKIDGCSGYICNTANWQYDLGTNERAYAYKWDRPKDTTGRIRSIYLGALGSDIITSSIRLDYEVNDASACKKASNSAQSSNL